jgi:hypothetical protein
LLAGRSKAVQRILLQGQPTERDGTIPETQATIHSKNDGLSHRPESFAYATECHHPWLQQ